MIINKIENTKKRNVFKLILEDNTNIEVYEDVIIEMNLLSKKEINIKDIQNKKDYYDIYYRVLNYISYRMRSEFEIDKYISKYTKDNNIKYKIINVLKDKKYINDCEFVKRFINDKLNLSKDGPLKIKRDLLNLNIDNTLIDNNINNIDNIEDRLKPLILKYMKIHNKYSIYELKRRTLSYFINLGYDKELINSLIQDNDIEVDSNVIQKEYDKLYRKYKDKYKKDLDYNIKMRLYQKGYTNDEIEKIRK